MTGLSPLIDSSVLREMLDYPGPPNKLPEVNFTDAKEDSACLKDFFDMLYGRDIVVKSLLFEGRVWNTVDFFRKYDCSRLCKVLRDEIKLELAVGESPTSSGKAYMLGVYMDDIGICIEALRRGFGKRYHKVERNSDEATVDDYLEGISFFEPGGMPARYIDSCPGRYVVALMRANQKLAAEGKRDRAEAARIVANEFRRIMHLVSTLPCCHMRKSAHSA